ncbi:MAG: cytochrome c [Chitinophagales bacterium]
MVTTKYIRLVLAAGMLGMVFTGCKKASGDYPGDQYTFDMISSRAYETYALNTEMPDSMSALLPVQGTVPYVGNAIAGTAGDSTDRTINLPYNIPNTPEGYEMAATAISSPLDQKDPKVIAQGQHFFVIYCAICHGVEGNGKGTIVVNEKYSAIPPSYYDPAILALPDGKMFHTLTYGKGAMQTYAFALSKKERWEVIAYINSLQDAYVAANPVNN